MAAAWRLIVGLGNPLPRYEATRHNVGYAVVDRVGQRAVFKKDGRAEALVATMRLRGYPVLLAKPQTYMNRSGYSVLALVRRYQLPPESVLVVTDDLNLPLGMVRVRAKGSAGGHNGVQDIIDHLEADTFPRIRVGIAGEYARGQQSDFVLSPFTSEELSVITEAIGRAAQATTAYVTDGITTAMNRFNRRAGKRRRKPPASPGPQESESGEVST